MTDDIKPQLIWVTGDATQGGSWNANQINPRFAPPQTQYARADVKTLAQELVKRFANPFDYKDMNDAILEHHVDWDAVYRRMRDDIAAGETMPTVLSSALVAISGFDPWGDAIEHDRSGE